jgi:hypothetical protein
MTIITPVENVELLERLQLKQVKDHLKIAVHMAATSNRIKLFDQLMTTHEEFSRYKAFHDTLTVIAGNITAHEAVGGGDEVPF